MHRLPRAGVLSAGLLALTLFVTPAAADTVKIVVPFPAGGPVDMVARLLAQELGPRLNADVVVENRGGAGGAIASEMVARAPADGKTLYVASHGSFVINAVLRRPRPTTRSRHSHRSRWWEPRLRCSSSGRIIPPPPLPSSSRAPSKGRR